MMEMMGLDGLATAPWISALGWALIHFLWQGALIGALFAGGCWLLRNGRPQARYVLGLICMAGLLVAPFATLWTLLQYSEPNTTVIAWPESHLAMMVTGDAAAQTWSSGWMFAQRLEQVLPWVVLGWAFGVLLMGGRVSLNWYRMIRCTRVGVRPLPAALLGRVAALTEIFGIHRSVRVLESTLLQVPTVLGWLRPVILLPTSSLVGLTPAQLELVIAHELGHIRRLDYLFNLFQVLVETLLYYHPVVGWISRRVRNEREQCCDDLVVARCGNRIEYARALTNLESMRSGYATPALAATDGQLVDRIERIVCAHGRNSEDAAGNSGLLVLIAGIVLLAGNLADPMAAFEERRSRLGDALVAQLLSEQGQRREFVALDEVSVRFVEQPAASTPEVPVAKLAGSDSAIVAATPQETAPAIPQTGPVPTPAAADSPMRSPLVIDHSRAIAAPSYDSRLAARPDRSPVPGFAPASSVQPAAGAGGQAPDLAIASRVPAETTPEALHPDRVASASGPVAIQRVSPEYPVRARIAGQQGYVVVDFTVRPDGRVADVQISDARPRRVFDRAAVRAIKGWRFDPGTVTGAERVTQRFDFSLQSGPLLDPDDRNCLPLTGSRICRPSSPTSLMAAEANLP